MKNPTIEAAKKFLTPALVIHTDITVKKADGIYVEDVRGKRYMDFTSGLAVANLGHRPPEVIKAIERQIKMLLHSGCIFHHASIVELAKKLSTITPYGLDMFFFSNSGAEAIEGAVKLARFYTKRQGIIAFTGGFHGRTLGALSLTTSAARYRKNYHPLLPSVFHAPYPYCYRCPMGMIKNNCSLECFEYLERTLKHHIAPEEVACVVIEPILGEGGYVVPPKGYLKRLREFTAKNKILFIADEVQSGFGRTGRWFACDEQSIEPDIMVMAKGIASGLPLSSIAGKKKIMKKWHPGAHGTTFGGNPVSAAAACATIDAIKKKGLLDNGRLVGSFALERLRDMQKKYPFIGDVRGVGLMIGVEFVKKDEIPDGRRLKKVLKRCEEKGLILIECGIDKNIVRFMPPLITTKKEMDKALTIFEESLIG